MKTKVISIFLVLLLVQALIYPIMAVDTSGLEQQRNEIKNNISDAEERKDEIQDDLDEQLSAISKLDSQITSLENEIKNIDMQISDLESSIEQKTKEVEQKQQEYDKNKGLLETRLVVMYETGETTFLDILLKSSSIVELLTNYYNYKQLVDCDMELLDKIEEERTSLENAKTELESQKEQTVKLKQDKEAKNNQLKVQKQDREAKANELSASQKELQSQIDEYNKKLNEIDSAIAEAMRNAMQNEQSGNGAGSNFGGTFIWPLDYSPRRVTSGMKFRWGRWHKGIDIGTNAEVGKSVIAAASGTVIYSAYQSGSSSAAGYGNYLIIYHGNGYATLYAHLNTKLVSTGQYVSQGQLIAYSGNTGGVAPHLHFEIRKATSVSNFFGNNWLNPLDYLPGGYVRVDV